MKSLVQVKEIGGRKFVIEWPYIGHPSIMLKMHGNKEVRCRILGYAKPDTPEMIYLKSSINEILDED